MIGYPQFIGKVPEDHWFKGERTYPDPKKTKINGMRPQFIIMDEIQGQTTIYDFIDDSYREQD